MLSFKTLQEIEKYIEEHFDPSCPVDVEPETASFDDPFLNDDSLDPIFGDGDGFVHHGPAEFAGDLEAPAVASEEPAVATEEIVPSGVTEAETSAASEISAESEVPAELEISAVSETPAEPSTVTASEHSEEAENETEPESEPESELESEIGEVPLIVAQGTLFTRRRSLFGKLLAMVDGTNRRAREREERYRDIPDDDYEDSAYEKGLHEDAVYADESAVKCASVEFAESSEIELSESAEAERIESADAERIESAIEQSDESAALHSAESDIAEPEFVGFCAPKMAPHILSDAVAADKYEAPAPSMPFAAAKSSIRSKAINLDLDRRIRTADEGFVDILLRKIDAAGLTDAQCYTKAQMNRSHFNRIKNDPNYHVMKRSVIALALALCLDRFQTDELLTSAGYALSNGSKADIIIQYCIEKGIYDVMEVNELLYAYDQPLLGAGLRN